MDKEDGNCDNHLMKWGHYFRLLTKEIGENSMGWILDDDPGCLRFVGDVDDA